jgi:hypothetical protein
MIFWVLENFSNWFESNGSQNAKVIKGIRKQKKKKEEKKKKTLNGPGENDSAQPRLWPAAHLPLSRTGTILSVSLGDCRSPHVGPCRHRLPQNRQPPRCRDWCSSVNLRNSRMQSLPRMWHFIAHPLLVLDAWWITSPLGTPRGRCDEYSS